MPRGLIKHAIDLDPHEEDCSDYEIKNKIIPNQCILFLLSEMNDLPVLAKWFPGGPSFALFPYPVIDQTKKGTGCTNCGERCSGHYITDLTHYLNLYSQGKALQSPPPSQILQDFYKENQSFVEADIERLDD